MGVKPSTNLILKQVAASFGWGNGRQWQMCGCLWVPEMPERHEGGRNFPEKGVSVHISKACIDGASDKAFTKAVELKYPWSQQWRGQVREG